MAEVTASARRNAGAMAHTWREWLGVWALWTLLAALGGIAGGAATLSWAAEVLDRGSVTAGRAGDVAVALALAGIVTGAAAGLVGGLGEWLVLRRWVQQAGWWIAATAVGRAIGWSLALTTGWMWSELIVGSTGTDSAGILGIDVGGVVGGSIVGLSQWLVLRRWVARAWWWIAATAVAGAAGLGLSQYVAQAAAAGAVSGGVAWVTAVGVAAAGVGAVTGVVLVLLFAQARAQDQGLTEAGKGWQLLGRPIIATVLLIGAGLAVPVWYLRHHGAIGSHPSIVRQPLAG